MNRFSIWQKLNPLFWVGNADDEPPAGYTAWTWFLRNPFHNLFFYVIGVSDQKTIRYGPEPGDVFAWGWKWNVTQVEGTWIYLPFIAYLNPNFRFYIGWRPGGALGVKINYSSAGTFTPP